MATTNSEKPKPSKHEAFEIARVNRSQIKNAPYNPRRISEDAKDRIRGNLKKRGLMHPLTWNRRTGNLVAGHQRLAALDHLEAGAEYSLTVAVVDLDDAAEREQNIFMNNPLAQGDWDVDLLGEVLKFQGLSHDAAGFDPADVYKLFGESPDAQGAEELEKLAEGLREINERVAKVKVRTEHPDDPNFYLVVVFDSAGTRDALMARVGWEDNRFVDGRKFLKALDAAAAPAQQSSGPSAGATTRQTTGGDRS